MPRIQSSSPPITPSITANQPTNGANARAAVTRQKRPAGHATLSKLASSGKKVLHARMPRKGKLAQPGANSSGAATSKPAVPKADAQVQANAHEGDLIDLSDPPPTTKPAGTQPSLLDAQPNDLHALHTPVLQPTVLHSAAAPAAHGAQPLAQTLAAAGMPSLQDIHHTTDQAIAMQHAIGQANQRLAIAEMLNSFMQKVIDMIKKAASQP
ncbi:Uncharacterised protein [Burkholderia pseudomallei]|nr:Uncharacterised protein [Burkholderia pseudomallei]CAJ6487856.1 Uncharacterised protein [Burkholderia pseudomallei]CAJ6896076.1 Uncharacterised protein [Burkholderia pseudomallei]CAJ8692390.1 Uncharacterised protein [Burkholderia pseudomallei]